MIDSDLVFPHCRHAFFAGCHDSGYVSFLSRYKHDQSAASKLSLIETYNTNHNYHDLGFRMTRFPTIFRTEDFPQPSIMPPPPGHTFRSHSTSDGTTPFAPMTAGIHSNTTSTGSRSSTPISTTAPSAASWAAVGKVNAQPITIDIAPTKKAPKKEAYYLVNRIGERIDETLPPHGQQAALSFDKRIRQNGGRNFCNVCVMFGENHCAQTDARHVHGNPHLTPQEMLVMRHKVRNLGCKFQSACDDPGCPYSHHCRYGKECVKGYDCVFQDTHHIDIVSHSPLAGYVAVD